MKKIMFITLTILFALSASSCRDKKEQNRTEQQIENAKENVNDALDKASNKIEDGADKDCHINLYISIYYLSFNLYRYEYSCYLGRWNSSDYKMRLGNRLPENTERKKTYGNPAGSPYKLDRSIPLYFLL